MIVGIDILEFIQAKRGEIRECLELDGEDVDLFAFGDIRVAILSEIFSGSLFIVAFRMPEIVKKDLLGIKPLQKVSFKKKNTKIRI